MLIGVGITLFNLTVPFPFYRSSYVLERTISGFFCLALQSIECINQALAQVFQDVYYSRVAATSGSQFQSVGCSWEWAFDSSKHRARLSHYSRLSIDCQYYVSTAFYYIYFHPLAKFPGPKSTAFSRLPLVGATIRGDIWKWLDKLHAEYGPIVRIAPDELTTISSNAWKDIYTSKPFLPKDPFSMTPPMNGADSLFTAEGHTHTRMRRTFINAFSDKALREQAPIIESYGNLLTTRLRREVAKSSEGTVDLAKYYGYATLDIIADLTFGDSFHGLEDDNEHSWILGFFLGAKFGSVRNSLSRFHPIDKVFGWIFLRLTATHRVRNWSIATNMITERLGMGDLGSERSDFITPVVGNVNEDKEKGITRKELNTNGLAVVIAGCQLPTVAIATATYLLSRYPHTLKALAHEIRSNFESDKDICIASTQNLPYLMAVINETLRIHHPTPINLPRIVQPQGQMIDGHFIPGNVSASFLYVSFDFFLPLSIV